MPNSVHLPRRIGIAATTTVVISSVVGSGIFTTTGFLSRDLGSPFIILALWTIGALLALSGALCYSELGTALPHAGGDYVYLRRTYGPMAGFLSGWTSLTVGFSAGIAAGAMSFSGYLEELASTDLPAPVTALFLIWIVTGVHLTGTKLGSLLQGSLTTITVGAILCLIVGAAVFGKGSWEHLSHTTAVSPPSPGAVLAAFLFVMYAYSGWNAASYLAGEVIQPDRSIPLALIFGTTLVGILYIALNLTFFYALPAEQLAASPILPVAQKAAVSLFGPEVATVVVIVLCVSLVGTVSAMIWSGPRVYFAMARDGTLPPLFASTSQATGLPLASILLQSLWASVLVITGSFEQLIIYSGSVLTFFSALTVLAVLVLRQREPDLPRPYRVPLYPLLPVCFLALSFTIVAFATIERPAEAGAGALTVVAGIPIFYLLRRSQSRVEGPTSSR